MSTAGKLAWAFTDTDDYHVALTKGYPVAAVFPDQGKDQIGTMLIPNSVSIVKGCPHPERARQLVDWILSEDVEAMLAAARSAQIPVSHCRPMSQSLSLKQVSPIGHRAHSAPPQSTPVSS